MLVGSEIYTRECIMCGTTFDRGEHRICCDNGFREVANGQEHLDGICIACCSCSPLGPRNNCGEGS